jgi:8-oxo-dGTP pyrophosphatase MutT (NUDIX family)
MNQIYLGELKKLVNSSYVNKSIFQEMQNFIKNNNEFTRPENPTHHFGAFAVPIHKPTKQILLVHHKKANSWIPPGGHLEKDEEPITTVIREFQEELNYQINTNQIKLFDISIKHVQNPGEKCQVHYDLWYVVTMNKPNNFTFDKKEFYAIKWVPFSAISSLVTVPNYRTVLNNLVKTL